MCAGAVLTLADVATVLVTLGSVRSAVGHDLTAGQWPTVMLTQVDFWLASAPIGAGVWLWLAWANGRGYHWGAACFHGAVRPPHNRAALRPRRGPLAVYLARRDRHNGALAGRAGGDGAHLQPDGQPVLPAGTSPAGACAGRAARPIPTLTGCATPSHCGSSVPSGPAAPAAPMPAAWRRGARASRSMRGRSGGDWPRSRPRSGAAAGPAPNDGPSVRHAHSPQIVRKKSVNHRPGRV